MAFKATATKYYQLSKPGIIYGNLLTAVAGYLYGSECNIDFSVFFGLIIGLSLVIAGACAINNYLDRKIDATMARTKKRSLVDGSMRPRNALIFSITATLLGLTILALSQNLLTVNLAAFAWFAYVILYGYGKRYSVHGTLVGCISGSIPLIAGYCAATNQLNLTAGLLFLLMTAWQMAHFYGIALYRLKDYKAARIPVMPAVRGVWTTQIQVLIYIVLFVAVIVAMVVTSRLNYISGALLVIISIVWLIKSLKTLPDLQSDIWGRKVFLFSLLVILALSATLSIDPLLPL